MALAYDFDIFDIVPDFGSSDPHLESVLGTLGSGAHHEETTVALFRDVRTADALRRAPAALRTYFLNSGFGLNTFDSGVPAGRYPVKDEAARLQLILRLTENAKRHPLAPHIGAPVGGDAFCLVSFLAALDAATPIDAPMATPSRPAQPRTPASVAALALFAAQADDLAPPGRFAAAVRGRFWPAPFLRAGAAAILVLGALSYGAGPVLATLARF